MSVLTGLGGGHVDDLAGSSLDDNVSSLSESGTLVSAEGQAARTMRRVEERGGGRRKKDEKSKKVSGCQRNAGNNFGGAFRKREHKEAEGEADSCLD